MNTKEHFHQKQLDYAARFKPLNDAWDGLVSQGKIHYNGDLLETRILDPQDGRLPFFLVFNSGRAEYLKNLPKIKKEGCPFCSDFEDLKIDDLPSLRILPNKFPCLPNQYVLAPKEHTLKINKEFIRDAISFAQQTGFKVYFNGQGSGAALNHLCFQASPKHPTSPKKDFFDLPRFSEPIGSDSSFSELRGYNCATMLFLNSGYCLNRVGGPVYGLEVHGKSSGIVDIIQDAFQKISKINLIVKDDDMDYISAYIFPRVKLEEPTNFPGWKFGALELMGNFVCRDKETFEKTDYESLERALKDVSLTTITKGYDPFYDETTVSILMESLGRVTRDIRVRNTDERLKSLIPNSTLSGNALIRYCEEQIQKRLEMMVAHEKQNGRDVTVVSFNPTSRTEDMFLLYNTARRELTSIESHPILQSAKSLYDNMPTSEYDLLGHDLDDRCRIKD